MCLSEISLEIKVTGYTIYLKRFLLAFLVLSQLCLSLICASSENYEPETSLRSRTIPVVRNITLWSRCSNKYIRILGRKIVANGNNSHGYARLRVVAAGEDSHVRIQSAMPKRQNICFTKKGRLKGRPVSRGKLCIFKELFVDGYTEFQSVANPNWYIGFRPKHGRALKGFQWMRKGKKCYQFMKEYPNSFFNSGFRSTKKPEVTLAEYIIKHLAREQRSPMS